MKKSVLLILCLGLLLSVLAGCSCDHEWRSATCEDPKTCRLCGETTGDALDHDWKDATCQAPKTCRECGKQKGEPAEHQWVEATCQQPKHCTECNEMEGVVIDHDWVEATTEAPKTCTMCASTEGERIITDERFTTAACQELFGTWTGETLFDGESVLGVTIEGEDLDFLAYVTMEFYNDGEMKMTIAYEHESYLRTTELYTIEVLYNTFAEQGLSRQEADQAMIAEYGMDVITYVEEYMKNVDPDEHTQESTFCYYVKDGNIYSGSSWDEDLGYTPYTLTENVLYITVDEIEMELTKQ